MNCLPELHAFCWGLLILTRLVEEMFCIVVAVLMLLPLTVTFSYL